jgi:hypothetical protein
MSGTPTQPGGVCVCVLGMHRSGTSALTHILQLLGVQIGDDFLPPAPDNTTSTPSARSGGRR